MAFRRNALRKRKTKAKRKTRRRSNKLVNRSSNFPIAPNYVTKMKYHQRFVITNSASPNTLSETLINMNNIFQPIVGGHQPFGHDQMSALYTKYRVFAMSWRIEIAPETGGIGGSITVVPQPLQSSSLAGADLGYVGELPGAVTKVMRPDSPIIFTGKRFLPRFVGLTPTQFKGNEDYDSSYGTSPSIVPTLALLTESDTASQTFTCFVTLMYHVESFAPKQISQS